MSLSKTTKAVLNIAIPDTPALTELVNAIDASGSGPAASIAAIGVTTNLPAAALSTTDIYTDAAVNAAINALKTASESRLDVIEAKIDAVIAALKAANMML